MKSNTPKGWLYHPISGVCRFISRWIFGLRVTGREQLPEKGPLLVLAAHQGMIDFMLSFAALKGRRLHFVATQRQYNNPSLHWAYRRLGVIPKVQFHSDPRCVMNMLRALRAGGAVVVFPAGQTSMWGTPGQIPPAIAHLVKRAGVPVCTLSLHGGFFSAPRFGGLHFGRTEADLELTFSPEEAKTLPEEEIFRRLEARLDYDEYAWQARTGTVFRGGNRAKGWQRVLFCCPRCGGYGLWRQKGSRILCAACGNAGRVDKSMRAAPQGEGSVIFPTLTQWRDWQEGLLANILARPGCRLETPVNVLIFDQNAASHRPGGQGLLRLDRREISFAGTLSGRPAVLSVEHAHLPGLSADPGKYIELYFPEQGLLRFVPEDQAAVTPIKLAQEYLHRQTLLSPEKGPGEPLPAAEPVSIEQAVTRQVRAALPENNQGGIL